MLIKSPQMMALAVGNSCGTGNMVIIILLFIIIIINYYY